jgi:hypothetical protein
MGATRFLKVYSQEGVQQALEEGFSVGVIGEIKPETDKVTIPHYIKKIYHKYNDANSGILGYDIIKIP